jgi:hypothetical protein
MVVRIFWPLGRANLISRRSWIKGQGLQLLGCSNAVYRSEPLLMRRKLCKMMWNVTSIDAVSMPLLLRHHLPCAITALSVRVACATSSVSLWLFVLEGTMKQPMFWLVFATMIVFGYSTLTQPKIGAEVRLLLAD